MKQKKIMFVFYCKTHVFITVNEIQWVHMDCDGDIVVLTYPSTNVRMLGSTW